MASIFMFGGFRYLNIDAKVGSTGVNLSDDVYLVQVLLRELLVNSFKQVVTKPPPLPTGAFNKETDEALGTYKKIKNEISRKYPLGNHKIYYEKNLDPIAGSIFAFGTKHPWAIVQMQGDLLDMMLLKELSRGTVEEYLYEKYPPLLFTFRK